MPARLALGVIESIRMRKLSLYFLGIVMGCLGMIRGAWAEDHAQATMVADVSTVQPGVPLMLGIKFTIDPGWHIYWKNPGDSGLATELKLTLPQGFTAGELLFPLPKRMEWPGPIINYGYENEVMLMVRITPPRGMKAGELVSIAAKANWLVCDKDNCIPGSKVLSVELPVSDAANPANVELFKHWTDQLPVTEDQADIASISKSRSITNGDGQAAISISWKKVPGDIQYFPGPFDSGLVQNVQLSTMGDVTKITFSIKSVKDSGAPPDEPLTGLVTFTPASGVNTGIELTMAAK